MAIDPNYMKIPSLGTSVYTFFNKEGKPDHIGVDVGTKYTFHFRNGRLIKIEDFTTGSWDVFSKKDEIEWWMNLKGSRKVYEDAVLPSLKRFKDRNERLKR